MNDIILHHYAGSLFSEKIRLLLGYYKLAWKSVVTAPIMPRPLLMPLTGGYRRTPNMQQGADVWCDTKIIAERLSEIAGDSALHAGFGNLRVAEWADSHLFRVVVAVTFQPRAVGGAMSTLSSTQIEAFMKDRAELTKGAPPIVAMAPETAEAHLAMYLLELDASLKSSQFLFGAKPVLADFSVYHCLWLVANNPTMVTLLEPYSNVTAWRARMAAFGHGNVTEISAEEALEIAKKATPAPIPKSAPLLPTGFVLGEQAAVVPTDYGLFPVSGELVVCNAHEYAVRRRDLTAGEIVTHFPRQGFVLTR
jgi:glutathione S-transferase